ncbi:intramembrane serine protease GlpG [compost metagenome]
MWRRFGPNWLSISTILTIATIIASCSVSYIVNHQLFSTITMPALKVYGGITFDDLRNLSLWRVITAQFIHAKQAHMFFNALCLFLLGRMIESKVGSLKTLSIWLIAGGIATVISPILIDAPWNVGTGASQATFAFAGCATVLVLAGILKRSLAWALIALTVLPGVTLDLIYSGYPKPGHIAGFMLGMLFGGVYLRPSNSGLIQQTNLRDQISDKLR